MFIHFMIKFTRCYLSCYVQMRIRRVKLKEEDNIILFIWWKWIEFTITTRAALNSCSADVNFHFYKCKQEAKDIPALLSMFRVKECFRSTVSTSNISTFVKQINWFRFTLNLFYCQQSHGSLQNRNRSVFIL